MTRHMKLHMKTQPGGLYIGKDKKDREVCSR